LKLFSIFIILVIIFGALQTTYAQVDELNRNIKISDEEEMILFGGFAIAVIVIILFLARDTILRRKTEYDKEDLESKKDRTYEKYHSDWGDDYEEIGKRKYSKEDKEFSDAVRNNELPDYYKILGISRDATQGEIKKKFRELAKKIHPDKTKEDSEEEMVELNRAYEVLSNKGSREKYDKYLKVD